MYSNADLNDEEVFALASFGPNDPRGTQCIHSSTSRACLPPHDSETCFSSPGPPKPPPSSSIPSLSITHLREPVICARGGAGTRSADPCRQATSRALPYCILIPRDHTLWCVERFMFVPTAAAPRAADWDACLWQVQLVTFGAATIGGPTGARVAMGCRS